MRQTLLILLAAVLLVASGLAVYEGYKIATAPEPKRVTNPFWVGGE